MTSSRFDPGSTSIRPQKPWTSPFYGSMNGPGMKTLTEESQIGFQSWVTNACDQVRSARMRGKQWKC